jgi:hypothetical protein
MGTIGQNSRLAVSQRLLDSALPFDRPAAVRLAEERSALRVLPGHDSQLHDLYAVVRRWSTIRVAHRTYMHRRNWWGTPSKRVYPRVVEVRYALCTFSA